MRLIKFLLVAVLFAAFASCTRIENNGPSPYTSIYEKMGTQEVAEFGTVQYTVGKVVRTSDLPQSFLDNFKIGDRKALIRCSATLKAGIDLSSGNYNVTVNGRQVVLQLPHAKIFEPINMDLDKVFLEYIKVGALRSNITNKEYLSYLQEAEKQILADENLKAQIIKQAESNAEPMFESMLKNLGFEAVKIEFTL
ncbi:MAG: DUF4230 domain-containing protein [Bacteroidales bacterium]|nr:DUF4230 domain-containing protein [Bacteroidales bacterium]